MKAIAWILMVWLGTGIGIELFVDEETIRESMAKRTFRGRVIAITFHVMAIALCWYVIRG